ncbi:MAG: glycine cleavage T C-terminal barrel domain-containing protein [Acidimicrobiia bacterium]
MSELPLLTSGRSGIVWVSGADAVSFLDGLLSQNIAAIPVGGTARSLLLSPKGKLRATLLVLRGSERIGLVCDAGRTGVVADDLRRFKIRVDVTIEVEPETIWERWGSGAADGIGAVPPPGSWSGEVPVRFRMPFRYGSEERILVVGSRPDGEKSGDDRVEVLRIAIGEAVMGVDLDDTTIPQEGVDVATAVDFTKGCYLGQELVARIDSRGHVNRSLTGLVIVGEPPDPGAEVIAGERPVGSVTSTAWSATLEKSLALAMIRVEVEPGSLVSVAGMPGEVVTLPMPLPM